MTSEISNFVQLNKKRPVYNNLVKDVKSDKRFKCYKSNVKNDECKEQSFDDIPKQVSDPITKLVDSYSSLSDRRIKLSQLILEKHIFEKLDPNITVPLISKPLEDMSRFQLKYTIIKDPNILKESVVHRVKKIETTVGHFMFEYLNLMNFFKIEMDFLINSRRVRNLIDTYTSNKYKLRVNLEPENYVSIQFII